jgi:hypothetical protein
MDAEALRTYVNEHPEGVVIRMVDGKVYRIPHRDYVWFTPSFGQPESRVGRYSTAFWLHDIEEATNRLVNAMLVRDVTPLKKNGRRRASSGRRPRRK